MANHYKVLTSDKLTGELINKYINEFIVEEAQDLFKVLYSKDARLSNDWDEHTWLVTFKENPNRFDEFKFWINEDYDLEFRHQPKYNIVRFIENKWISYLSKKLTNSKLYDDGIGFYKDSNILEYSGYRDYYINTIPSRKPFWRWYFKTNFHWKLIMKGLGKYNKLF